MVDAHVHLETGPYSLEWVDTYVDWARRAGVTELYLLEHSHRFVEFKDCYRKVVAYDGYQSAWFEARNTVSLQSYLDLMDKYRKNRHPGIVVKWGLELCYLERIHRPIQAFGLKRAFDYLTGSIHWIDGWGFDHKRESWSGRDVDAVYRAYFQLEVDLIASGLFDHLAHPDSIKCFGHYPGFSLEDEYHRVAEGAKKAKIRLEQSCGLYNNYGHPSLGLEPEFLRILKAAGVDLVTASDAHRPEDIGQNIPAAEELIRRA